MRHGSTPLGNSYRSVGLLAWAVAMAASWAGCVNSPYDQQVFASKGSVVPLIGATPRPDTELLDVRAYDYASDSWQHVRWLSPYPSVLGNMGTYPPPFDTWHPFYDTGLTLGNDKWLPLVTNLGNVNTNEGTARVQISDPLNGPYYVLEPGYSQCVQGYATFAEATHPDNCGDYGDQHFSQIFTDGYDDSHYSRRPVVVARHYLATGVDTAFAEGVLHSASALIQRKDPNASDPDGSEDYACAAEWYLSGNVRTIYSSTTLSNGVSNPDDDGVPTTAAEIDWYRQYGAQIRGASDRRVVIVVRGMQNCEGSGSVAGCADPDELNVAIVTQGRAILAGSEYNISPWSPQSIGPIWAHELLHTHSGRFGHSPDPTSLLHAGNDMSNARRIDGTTGLPPALQTACESIRDYD